MLPGTGPARRDLVVVGASAGGIPALRHLVAGLPADLPATVLVVVHMRPEGPSMLHAILDRSGPLPVVQARDGDALVPGQIIVAVPGRHLVVEGSRIRTVLGPRENRYRPSVDVLFRSAAVARGPRVVAVVLSGTLDDGAAGMVAVKKHGGLCLVQDPNDALYPGMPLRAIENVEPDHKVPSSELGPLLARLTREEIPGAVAVRDEIESNEVSIVKGQAVEPEMIGQPSPFTCPECTGVLWEIDEPEVLRFRCRVGHAYTADSLLSGQEEAQEAALWAGMCALEENARLSERLAERFRVRQLERLAQRMTEKARHAQTQADQIRDVIANLATEVGVTEEIR